MTDSNSNELPDFFKSVLDEGSEGVPPPPPQTPHQQIYQEVVIDPGTGLPRQAGSSQVEGQFIKILRMMAERNLYFFCKAILGLDRLVFHLHGDVCKFLQKSPPYRKLVLLPRDHFKTTIVAKSLPIHKFIQPKEHNIYWPGHDGLETKILLCGENLKNASKHIQWIEAHLEKNTLIRALWPGKVWDNPKRDARAWNNEQFFLPRELRYEQSDPTMQGIGVGGAITGSHVTDIIDDDLVTFEAAMSPPVMEEAKNWQKLSRALLEDPEESHEYIVGTRWAVNDMYGDIIQNDPTVQVYRRSVVENGKPIFPEEFSMSVIEELKSSFGFWFPLLYMNDPRDSLLVDFTEADIRWYEDLGTMIQFESDHRDEKLLGVIAPEKEDIPKPAGADRFRTVQQYLYEEGGREEYLAHKYPE